MHLATQVTVQQHHGRHVKKKEQHQHCTYTTQHKRALGTCQTMNNVLMCVRNTPLEDIIEKATDKPADKLIEKIK